MKKLFRPEFLNRIDATIVFRALGREQIREIIDLLLKRVQTQLTEQRMTLEVTEGAKDVLMEKGFDQIYGARPMRRAIQNADRGPAGRGAAPRQLPAGRHGHRGRAGRRDRARVKEREAPRARAGAGRDGVAVSRQESVVRRGRADMARPAFAVRRSALSALGAGLG